MNNKLMNDFELFIQKQKLAQLIEIQLESIKDAQDGTNTQCLVNEVLRDAKQLAELTLKKAA